MQLTKDVEINGTQYQIGRFPARVGSWILTQVLTKVLPVAMPSIEGDLPKNRMALSEEEFASIQGHCLAVCRQYSSQGLPVPVFVLPNTWTVKELEYDLGTVMALTIHAISLNVGSFFSEGGLANLTASLPKISISK